MISPGDMIYWDSPALGLVGPGRVDSILDEYMVMVNHPITCAIVPIMRSWIVDGKQKGEKRDSWGLK